MSKATWELHYSQVLQFGVYVKSRMDSSGALPAIPRGLRSDSHRPLASTLLVVVGGGLPIRWLNRINPDARSATFKPTRAVRLLGYYRYLYPFSRSRCRPGADSLTFPGGEHHAEEAVGAEVPRVPLCAHQPAF